MDVPLVASDDADITDATFAGLDFCKVYGSIYIHLINIIIKNTNIPARTYIKISIVTTKKQMRKIYSRWINVAKVKVKVKVKVEKKIQQVKLTAKSNGGIEQDV
jgi:hypothetical protein